MIWGQAVLIGIPIITFHQENFVESENKKYAHFLATAAAVIVFFALAACQSSTLVPTATSTATIEVPQLFNLTPSPIPTSALEGAITTESGLQYLEITTGDGAVPQKGDILSMHFIASLADGTELVNSYTDGQPATVIWGRENLLPGWEEGIGMMKEGGKAKLLLSPDLAFGEEGVSGIPANSQIIIEVELLSVKTPPTPSSVAPEKLIKNTSGLQYFDLILGQGTEAFEKSTVSTQFTIWVKTETGYDFIASSEGSEPLDFVLGRGDIVFPGWEEGVTGMKIGGKRFLIIPPELGMGETGNGDIPANATLVMEIELMDVIEPRVAFKVDEKDYITTESGLKYFDLTAGTGDTPVAGQTVVVHYTGWLEDGTQFDSSVDRDEPFTFVIGQGNVIPGWDEGLISMRVGSKRQLVIPAALAYGETGSGSVIPPNATLIFEVELIEIQP
jgi:peptidylprolyl isomerase